MENSIGVPARLTWLGPHRAALMSSLEDALKAADQHAKAEAIGQADMFGVLAEAPEQDRAAYANIPKWQDEIILEAGAGNTRAVSYRTSDKPLV